jgi:hypothetical protein
MEALHMEIKLHTVGEIVDGDEYKGWYVFIQTYKTGLSYLILIADNITFGRDEEGNLIGGEGYDDWMENMESLKMFFSGRNWKIKWLDWKPSWLPDEAE